MNLFHLYLKCCRAAVDLIASSHSLLFTKGEPQLTTIFSDKYDNSNEREPAWVFPSRGLPQSIMNINLFFDTLLKPEHSETLGKSDVCDQFF